MNSPLSHLHSLLNAYSLRKFKKGQTLLFQGEVPRYAYVVKSGTVKTYNISPLGEEQLISLSSEYDILPEAWFLGEASVAYYFYEAFVDCTVYAIPRDELIKKVSESPAFANHLLQRFMRLYVGASVHINALEQPRSRDKLVHLLHYLVMRFGEDIGRDRIRIELRLTHQTLANMLGVTRETIATEIARLRRERVVDYKQ
ncbi:MAG TPA: Crp/Fnr family transcriptional regulator, partial [Candidatus Saccharimonadales bacterium]|nr:Crp/Fnr family transcriptional regulator [Candidatus Saccharimonadales bacterium]